MGEDITVIGYDGEPWSPQAQERMDAATLIAGGVRQLAHVRPGPGVETRVMGEVTGAVDRIIDHHGKVVVLASGDPGFFGIVQTLRTKGARPEVWPARSSVALAFARIGLPWDDAAVVSAHGRDMRRCVNACRALPKVAVFTAPGAGPAELGASLVDWARTLIVAERLGEPDEALTRCDPATAAARTWRDPNLVLVLDETRTIHGPQWTNQVAVPPEDWALSEDRYVHRAGMVTKREVRAYVLSQLRPTLGMLVWDVGAGSGSVSVECASMSAAVIAVDSDPEACSYIRRNASVRRVDVRVVEGMAPGVLAGLPQPDAVFVGGGGLPVLEAVVRHRPSTVVATYTAVDRVGPARWLMVSAGYHVEGVQLAMSRLAEVPGGAVRLAAENPVFLLTGRLP